MSNENFSYELSDSFSKLVPYKASSPKSGKV